jgi:hypothetical protein
MYEFTHPRVNLPAHYAVLVPARSAIYQWPSDQ